MKKINFNNNWSFFKEGNEKNAIMVDLPHDAQILEKRSPELPMDSGYFPGGKYIYTKTFLFTDEYEDKALLLEFDGVYMNAEVYINGNKAGFQPYGYTNFIVEVDEHIKINEENEIMVIVDNSSFPNSRWYTGSGIYRDVYLHIGSKCYLAPYEVKIDTLSYNPAKISVSVDTKNSKGCKVKTDIYYDAELVASVVGFNNEIVIPDAHLWSAESPNLYTARVQLIEGGKVVDVTEEIFGIRKIEWKASFGMRINGEEVLLRGGCIHHDNGLLGAAAYKSSEERKVIKLKEAGFNAIRSSHNMCSKVLLEACDKHGMYVMDEFADMWTQHKHKHDYATQFSKWYEHDLSSMIKKDYNHPSVIMYSIGNEVGESATAEGIEYARKMTELVHKADKSRPVTCGINLLLNGLTAMGKGLYQGDGMALSKNSSKSNKKKESGSTFVNSIMNNMGAILNFIGRLKKFDNATKEVFSVLDIAGYNYGSGRYKVDPEKYPDRITVGSETFPPSLYKNWEDVKLYPNLIGDFMWTAWDYIGEAGIGVVGYGKEPGMLKSYPTMLAGCGVIEITGEKRPEVYLNQIIWGLRNKPYLAVEPLTKAGEKANFGMWRSSDSRHSWAWSGSEGKETTVRVYSPGSKVELRLNNRIIGKRQVKACKAVFKKVKYEPGELKAVSYDAYGNFLAEDSLWSAEENLRLLIVPEQEKFTEDSLIYSNIYLEDKEGVREYGKDTDVTVSVEGGSILAFGSANPAPEKAYQNSCCKTFYGMVQLIIKPNRESNLVNIIASSELTIKSTILVKKQ